MSIIERYGDDYEAGRALGPGVSVVEKPVNQLETGRAVVFVGQGVVWAQEG